jgi:hypothetical protein
VWEGWRREYGKVPSTEHVSQARELEIRPVLKNNLEVRISAGKCVYYFKYVTVTNVTPIKHNSTVDH